MFSTDRKRQIKTKVQIQNTAGNKESLALHNQLHSLQSGKTQGAFCLVQGRNQWGVNQNYWAEPAKWLISSFLSRDIVILSLHISRRQDRIMLMFLCSCRIHQPVCEIQASMLRDNVQRWRNVLWRKTVPTIFVYQPQRRSRKFVCLQTSPIFLQFQHLSKIRGNRISLFSILAIKQRRLSSVIPA